MINGLKNIRQENINPNRKKEKREIKMTIKLRPYQELYFFKEEKRKNNDYI